MSSCNWTEEENSLLIELYPHMTNEQITPRFSRTKNAICLQARKLGLAKTSEQISISMSHSRLPENKYSINENYFHDINTPIKAYWLGWMWADGWVLKAKNWTGFNVGLAVKELDGYIIEKLKKSIESSAPITTRNKEPYKQCRLSLYCKQIGVDLISHGVIPNKSYHAEEPIGIPDELLSHFIRGVFEGDGCIHIDKKGASHFQILGTEIFINWLHKTIGEQIGIVGTVHIHVGASSMRTFRYGLFAKSNVTKLAQWMYQDCGEFKLERKYKKFMENGLL